MRIRLFVTATATMILGWPLAAHASCKEGICVSGRDEGNIHIIDFTSNWKNITHFNFNDGHGQRELGSNERQVTIPLSSSRPITIHYGFQACGGGGFLQKSGCTPWAQFEHTAQ
jgi:hypothetical protein